MTFYYPLTLHNHISDFFLLITGFLGFIKIFIFHKVVTKIRTVWITTRNQTETFYITYTRFFFIISNTL